jgi:hypothetical protein
MKESAPTTTKQDRRVFRIVLWRVSILVYLVGGPKCVLAAAASSGTKCGLYFAPSSIPGAGFGIFAGDQPYRKGDIVGAGDIAFPIVEYEWHNLNQHEEYPFLWDEYTWTGDTINGMEGEGDDIDFIMVATPGLGAATNGHLGLMNVKDNGGKLSRALSTDKPGVGAISPFNDRAFSAKTDIPSGAEIFLK